MQSLLDSWSSLYANHSALRTAIEFLHIGGLVLAGGCAIAADRITLVAAGQPLAKRVARLEPLQGTHQVVIVGLVIVIVSGILMFAADVGTFLYSKVFWLKMLLFLMLLVNGSLLLRAERQVDRGTRDGWTPLTYASAASLVLWSLTTLAGAALPNIG
jgi:hypothetical protein